MAVSNEVLKIRKQQAMEADRKFVQQMRDRMMVASGTPGKKINVAAPLRYRVSQ